MGGMQPQRIRIVSVDVVKVDLTAGIAFIAYTLRAPVGDNHSATDLSVSDAETMMSELFEAARQKAATLAQVFSGQKVAPATYQIADEQATRDRLAALFSRLIEARAQHRDGRLGATELVALETDGVHLLRPEFDLEGKPDAERADILRKRASLMLDQSDPQTARVFAQRALRLVPDDAACQELVARCQ